jgi:hypothetical protein
MSQKQLRQYAAAMDAAFAEHNVPNDVIHAVNNYIAIAEQESYTAGYDDGVCDGGFNP